MKPRLATPADDALLTSIVTHPDVRRWNAHDGAPAFDPTAYTAHPRSFAVIVDDKLGATGAFLASCLEKGAYCVHTNLLPGTRGARAIRAGHDALSFAFVHTDAQQLVSMVPKCNPQALWFAHTMGFQDTFVRRQTWLWQAQMWDMQYLRFDIDDWALSGAYAPLGASFHEQRTKQGHAPNHRDDPVHDAYVGAAWAQIAAGNVDKGCRFYNRWARAAGYACTSIVNRDPLEVDIGDIVLRANDTGFTVKEPVHA